MDAFGWIVPTATERDADGRGKASSSSSSRTRVDAEKRVENFRTRSESSS
jgi:hypothetical protein